jgi:cystathionine gamma-lyase
VDNISFIINQLAEDREQYFNAVAPPIIQTSNFAFKDFKSLRETFEDEFSGEYIYTKSRNPTVDILRKKIAALQGSEDALVTNSGSSAIFCSILANVKSGDHIISVAQPYSWAARMFEVVLPRFNITHTYVDGRDIQNFVDACRSNTTLIYLESPNSWDYQLQDLEAVADFAKSKNITTIIDNSYCSPLYQKPHEFGIDLCLHSATKYLGGHSDVVHGVLIVNTDELNEQLSFIQNSCGAVPGPHDCWLVLRGIKTLHVRMQRHCENGEKIAHYLRNHSAIEKVYWIGFEDHPNHAVAKKQMRGFGGMISFVLKGDDVEKAMKVLSGTKLFALAESLGGVESLIGHPASMTHGSIPREERLKNGLADSLIRLSVGIEDVDDLIADLEQALAL